MSKSKGNVVYVEDLLKRHYAPRDIRFFLLNGHYRKKQNITSDLLKRSRKSLETLRRDIRLVCRPDPSVQRSDRSARNAIRKMVPDFEKAMGNDLHADEAVKGVTDKVKLLAGLKRKNKLKAKDSNKIREHIANIDRVLRVFDM